MSLITKLFYSTIQQQVNQQVTQVAADLYSRNMFRYMNDGQPVFISDTNLDVYVTDGFEAMPAIYECVDLILKKGAACPILTYRVKKGKENKLQQFKALYYSSDIEAKARAAVMKAEVLEEVTHPDIQRILDRPNEDEDMTDIIEYMIAGLLLPGNSYLYRNGPDPANNRYNELFWLPPSRMSIISGGMFNPIKGYAMDYQTASQDLFEKRDIVHIKTFNPGYSTTGSHLYGIPPLRAYLSHLSRNKDISKEINKQIKNGGAFGVLGPKNPKDEWTDDQRRAQKEKLVEAQYSTDYLARIFPSNVALDWTQIGLPIADQELLKLVGADREDIYRAYHIPLQFANQDSSTFNNQDVADRKLVYNAIAPVTNKVSVGLTKAICDPVNARTGDKYMILLDYNALPEMQSDNQKVAEYLEKSWWITPNQKREAMGYGRSDEAGMDSVWIPGDLRPISNAVLTEQQFTDAFNQGGN